MAIRDPERYFDRRTIKRHLKRGHASEADYQSYLETLPDSIDNVKPPQDGGDDDGFEARAQAKARRQAGGGAEGSPTPLSATFPPLRRAPIDNDDDDDDDDDYDDDDDDDESSGDSSTPSGDGDAPRSDGGGGEPSGDDNPS